MLTLLRFWVGVVCCLRFHLVTLRIRIVKLLVVTSCFVVFVVTCSCLRWWVVLGFCCCLFSSDRINVWCFALLDAYIAWAASVLA